MIEVWTNTNKEKSTPDLSVLIPFYKDNPIDLLQAFMTQELNHGAIEILFYDDGTNDQAIITALKTCAKQSAILVKLLLNTENNGRSFARNQLMQNARGKWILYLDADMRPMSASFLDNYLNAIKNETADILFGGFEVSKQKQNSNTELHRVLSKTSDCLSADERRKAGAQYVCSSNLCVKKSVLEAEPFDAGFSGWGWEDSEWAARVSEKYNLEHIDNPALHLGLESTETLLERFKSSGKNYLRFISAHPELAKTLSLYRIAKKLGRIPGQKLMRPILKLLVKTKFMPAKIRLLALKLWRASWYAELLS